MKYWFTVWDDSADTSNKSGSYDSLSDVLDAAFNQWNIYQSSEQNNKYMAIHYSKNGFDDINKKIIDIYPLILGTYDDTVDNLFVKSYIKYGRAEQNPTDFWSTDLRPDKQIRVKEEIIKSLYYGTNLFDIDDYIKELHDSELISNEDKTYYEIWSRSAMEVAIELTKSLVDFKEEAKLEATNQHNIQIAPSKNIEL